MKKEIQELNDKLNLNMTYLIEQINSVDERGEKNFNMIHVNEVMIQKNEQKNQDNLDGLLQKVSKLSSSVELNNDKILELGQKIEKNTMEIQSNFDIFGQKCKCKMNTLKCLLI